MSGLRVNDVVEVVDADPGWPALYAAEAEAICRVLGPSSTAIQFEHIGSTAVPGLAAKPIIDLLLISADADWPREILLTALPKLGYVFWEDNPDSRHLFFVKGMPPFGTRRTHHVHVRRRADALPILAFRDQLRARADLSREYELLKRALAARSSTDREAYTRGKDEFVARVLASVGDNRR